MVLKLIFDSHNTYLAQRAKRILAAHKIKAKVTQDRDIYIEAEDIVEASKILEQELYNSLFFKGAEVVDEARGDEAKLMPYSLGVCPRCIKQMLDPNSRRYFYPFSSCATCSNQAAFANFPYTRQNSLFSAFKPCKECQMEQAQNPYFQDYPLISCSNCNVPIVVRDKAKEFWANESSEFKEAFSILANALKDGKKVAIKHLDGYRSYSLRPFPGAKLLIANAALALPKLLLLHQEKSALFSIERPQIFATVASSELKEQIGDIARVMAFDDGFSFLLISLLQDEAFLFYEESSAADLVMEYLLEPKRYAPLRLLQIKRHRVFEGERALLPKPLVSQRCVVEGEYVLYDGVLDKKDSFEEIVCSEVVTFDDTIEHSNIKRAKLALAALASVAKEHGIEDKMLGFYFGKQKRFYYYDKKRWRLVFDFGEISQNMEQAIAMARKGSDKLIQNFLGRFNVDIESGDFWQRAARIIGVDGGYEELRLIGMHYGGKSGVSIDCRVQEDRFSYEAFYASLMSFRLAEAKSTLLAYSIFESLGEFVSQQLRSLGAELKVEHFLLAGKFITNSPFMSRFTRNVPNVKLNQEFPTDGFNGIYGLL